MTLGSRTLRGTLWSFGGYQTVAVLSFAVSVIAARALEPAALGRYAVVAMIVALATSASSLQMGGYYVVAETATPRLLRTGLALELAIGSTMFAAVAGAAAAYAAATGDSQLSWLVVAAATVLLVNPFGSLAAYFTRELDYRPPMLVQAGATAVACATKAALLLSGAGVWGLVVGDVALSVLVALTMLALVPAGRGLAFDRALARQQLAFGVPSLATGLLSNACVRAPEAAVATLLGTRELGVYYVASRLPAQLFQLGRSLSVALLPAFSRASLEQLERGFAAAVRLSALFIGLPLGFLLVFAEPFVASVYGERWRGAAVPLAVLTSAVAARFVFWHVGNLLKARRRVREMTWLTAGHLALLAPACALGAAVGGLSGVAAAVLAVELALVPIRLALARSVVRVAVGEALARPAAAVLAAVAAGLAAAALLGPGTSLVVGAVVMVAAFSPLVWRSDGLQLARTLLPRARAGA